MDQQFEDGPSFPKVLDKEDPLRHFRERFYLKEGVINLCGNSLGLCTKDAEDSLLKALDIWKEEGILMWGTQNYKYHLFSNYLAQRMAPLINADPEEVVITSSTTVNIHQAISTFYKPTVSKYKILIDDINFPTDRYAVESQVRLKGYEARDAVKVVKTRDGRFIHEEDIIHAMTNDVAIVLLPAVYYKSSQLLDIKNISRVAKERDIIIGWDLCHAVGTVEIDFKAIEVDFAVWCTYKYLNGGPGATAGLYMNRKHFQRLPGLTGWYGNKKETQFLLKQEFDHQEDASGWQIGTPSIFCMSTLEGSLKICNEAGISNIRKKSLRITGYLMYLIENKLAHYGFVIGNPKEDSKRGGHVCIEHDEGYRIGLAMKARNIVPDFREPNVIRLAPTALYTSYEEVYNVVDILMNIMKNESYKKFNERRGFVV